MPSPTTTNANNQRQNKNKMAASSPSGSDQSSNLLSQATPSPAGAAAGAVAVAAAPISRPSNYTSNICRKSYAATLNSGVSGPNQRESFDSNAYGKRRGSDGNTGGSDDNTLSFRDEGIGEAIPPNSSNHGKNKKQGGGMWRNYTKSYAHGTTSAAGAAAAAGGGASKNMTDSSKKRAQARRKKKKDTKLLQKIRRGAFGGAKSSPSPNKTKSKSKTPEENNDGDGKIQIQTSPAEATTNNGSKGSLSSSKMSALINENTPAFRQSSSGRKRPLRSSSPSNKDNTSSAPLASNNNNINAKKPPEPAQELDHDAPHKFRESYETKNSHSRKNRRNIQSIQKNMESALLISTTLEIVDDQEERKEHLEGMSQLTCTQGMTQSWGARYSHGGGGGGGVGQEEEEEDKGNDENENDGGVEAGEEEVDFGGDDNGPDFDVEDDDHREEVGFDDNSGHAEKKAGSKESIAGHQLKKNGNKRSDNADIEEGREPAAAAKKPAPINKPAAAPSLLTAGINVGKQQSRSSGSGSEDEYQTDNQNSDKEDEEEKEEERKPASEPVTRRRLPLTRSAKKKQQPNAARKKKAVKKGRRGGATALALAAEHKEAENIGTTNKRPNASRTRAGRKRAGRGGATTLALAEEEEEEETENIDTSGGVDDEADEHNATKKKGKNKRKQKQNPTALALAEYDETGEVDSYFDREAAARKEKLKTLAKRAEADRMDTGNDEHNVNDFEEDYGHTSFNGDDDDDDVIGTEKQSESLLGTEQQSEPLVGTEKQSEPKQSDQLSSMDKPLSEPLLSSSVPEPGATATSATAVEPTNENNASPCNNDTGTTRTASEMIVALRSEVDEIGRALMCPICRCTLRNAHLLPCVHAFCSGCLKDYFRPKPMVDPKNKRRKLSPIKVKNECPVCKISNRGVRAGVAAPHLDEMVRAYKGMGRAFGFAPVVYERDIVMTQLDPEENNGYHTESEDEEDKKMPAKETEDGRKKRDSNLHEYQQHLQVCQAVRGALEENESHLLQKPQPENLREKITHGNELRRMRQMVQEQDAVVRADEAAFEREVGRTRRKGGAKEMVAAVTAKFASEAANKVRKTVGAVGSGEKEVAVAATKRVVRAKKVPEEAAAILPTSSMNSAATGNMNSLSSKTEATITEKDRKKTPNMVQDVNLANSAETRKKSGQVDHNALVSQIEREKATSSDNATLKARANASDKENGLNVDQEEEEETYCTARDESQYSTAREESQEGSLLNATMARVSSSSPMMIHDGNTVQKKKVALGLSKRAPSKRSSSLRGTNVFNLERSPESVKASSAKTRSDSLQNESLATSTSALMKHQARDSMVTAATSGTSSSPILLHDGNTIRKKDRRRKRANFGNASLIDNDLDHDDNDPTPRRSGHLFPLPTAAEDATKAIAASTTDDNFIDFGGSNADPFDDGIADTIIGTGNDAVHEPKQRVAVVAAAAVSSPTSAAEQQQAAAKTPVVKEQIIDKGTIVVVQARTWPGINKPGGVARVTKVHHADINGGNSNKYDVAYVLGGKEKCVDESFISLQESDPLPTIDENCSIDSPQVATRGRRVSRGSMTPETKLRPIRPRKAAAVKKMKAKPLTATAVASSVIPIYNDEELKHIPTDVLQWAGIVLPGNKQNKKKGNAKKAEGCSGRGNKKRVLAESNPNAGAKSNKPAKKQRTAPTVAGTKSRKPTLVPRKAANKSPEINDPASLQGLSQIIRQLSTEEIVALANARYSSLLSLDRKQPSLLSKSKHSDRTEILTLYAVTSSLTEKDSEKLDLLCKMLKTNQVILKITKDFNHNKTQICITASAASAPSSTTKHSSSNNNDNESTLENVVSKSRTLKVMRSALAGIPILTPHWMEACLKEGHMVAPVGNMCIRTLPRKKHQHQQASSAVVGTGEKNVEDGQLQDLPTERFGVAKYAGACQMASQSSSSGSSCSFRHLLSGVSVVLLCSTSGGSGMIKDLKVLLQQAGASIVSSASAASRLLTNMSKGESAPEGQLVFLCDDSLTDKSCGISDALFKQAKKLVVGNSNNLLLCVHFNWLFDSISCVTLMKADAYEPLAPRAKALWSLTTTENPNASGRVDNRKESQIY